jgi:hypothetical protein
MVNRRKKKKTQKAFWMDLFDFCLENQTKNYKNKFMLC